MNAVRCCSRYRTSMPGKNLLVPIGLIIVVLLLICGVIHFGPNRSCQLSVSTANVSQPIDSSQKVILNEDQRTFQLRPKNDGPNNDLAETMNPQTADEAYFQYLFNRKYICEDYVRLGNPVDGGWDVCIMGPFALNRGCLVYSFGINYDFSFDDAVSIKYGCTVRSFDPSMRVDDHRRGPNIWFYKIGLGGKDGTAANGWKMKSLDSIVNFTNDSGKIIDYLKMDIEGSEWPAIESMFSSAILQRVKQLAVEIHIFPLGVTDPKTFYSKWKILRRLESLGFRHWYWHFNFYGAYKFESKMRTCCYELVYVNTNFIQAAANKLT